MVCHLICRLSTFFSPKNLKTRPTEHTENAEKKIPLGEFLIRKGIAQEQIDREQGLPVPQNSLLKIGH